jgi:hypothetical protein
MREVSDVILYIGFSRETMLQHDNRPVYISLWSLYVICDSDNWTRDAGTSSAVDTYSAGHEIPHIYEA